MDDLLTAIDRGSALSNQVSSDLEEATRFWLHVDYPLFSNPEKGDKVVPDIYQSFLSLVNSGGPEAPGFRVVPRSFTNIHHERIRSSNPDKIRSNNNEDTFWLLSPDFSSEIEREVLPIVSPKGSLTLWKSGIVHDNTTGVYNINPNNKDTLDPLARLVVYLCYVPRFWATEEEVLLRRKIYRRKQITTHWPVTFLSLHDDTVCRWPSLKMAVRFPAINSLVPLK